MSHPTESAKTFMKDWNGRYPSESPVPVEDEEQFIASWYGLKEYDKFTRLSLTIDDLVDLLQGSCEHNSQTRKQK